MRGLALWFMGCFVALATQARADQDWLAGVDQQAEVAALQPAHSRLWYEPGKDGVGAFVHVDRSGPGKLVTVIFYGRDSAGPLWAIGAAEGARFAADMVLFEALTVLGEPAAEPVLGDAVGTALLVVDPLLDGADACAALSLSVTLGDAADTLLLRPLTDAAGGALCRLCPAVDFGPAPSECL